MASFHNRISDLLKKIFNTWLIILHLQYQHCYDNSVKSKAPSVILYSDSELEVLLNKNNEDSGIKLNFRISSIYIISNKEYSHVKNEGILYF